jgi:hypothetical protein
VHVSWDACGFTCCACGFNTHDWCWLTTCAFGEIVVMLSASTHLTPTRRGAAAEDRNIKQAKSFLSTLARRMPGQSTLWNTTKSAAAIHAGRDAINQEYHADEYAPKQQEVIHVTDARAMPSLLTLGEEVQFLNIVPGSHLATAVRNPPLSIPPLNRTSLHYHPVLTLHRVSLDSAMPTILKEMGANWNQGPLPVKSDLRLRL